MRNNLPGPKSSLALSILACGLALAPLESAAFQSTGTCSTSTALPAAATEMVSADFNGDLRPDLAVTVPESGSVLILFGKGEGGFLAPVPLWPGGDPAGLVAADFDEDGHADLAVTHPSRWELTVHLGRGDGTFEDPSVHYGPGAPVSVTSEDFNGDDILDLGVVARDQARIFVFFGQGTSGVGNGEFSTAIYSPIGSMTNRPTRVRSLDLDRDGAVDVAFVIPNIDQVGLMFGRKNVSGLPDGTFNSLITLNPGSGVADLVLGDFDRNGLLDVTAACAGARTLGTVNVRADRTLTALSSRAVPIRIRRLALADHDGDGEADLTGVSTDSLHLITTLGIEWTSPVRPGLEAICPLDVDSDSFAEVGLASSNPGSVFLRYIRDCSAPPPPPLPPPLPPPPPSPPLTLWPAGQWGENGRLLVSEVGLIDRLEAIPDAAGSTAIRSTNAFPRLDRMNAGRASGP